MKKDYTFRLLLTIAIAIFLKVFVFAAGKGYLITKDEKYITGQIMAVNYTLADSEVIFMNDFGDLYQIHPYLIKGFVYREDEKTIEYESKFNGQNWLFLKIEIGGRGIRMYQMNSVIATQTPGLNYEIKTQVSKQFWLEKEGEKPFQIYLLCFRRSMRKITSDFPELASKIGEKGFRYKNLKAILIDYNEWYVDTRIML
jgi:hypothetical protein